jgi:CRP-like cAMP-binding protein
MIHRASDRCRPALERIAHFLLELLTRLQAVGLAEAQSFRLPLTQELIGDALGLSLPHVNRTLRRLREDGLVRIEDQRVTINDFDTLSALRLRAELSQPVSPARFS